MCGGKSCGIVLAKGILLYHRMGCYMMYWSVIDVHHWVSQGSPSELLNTKWQFTGPWLLNLWGECTGCCSTVVSGVVGSKDKFSLMETW